MFQGLTNLTQWGELAAIAALSVFFFNIAKFLILAFIRHFQISRLLSSKRTISMLVDSEEEDNIKLACHTYYKTGLTNSFTFGKWELHRMIPIQGNSGVFVIDKNDILRQCKSPSGSYNFTLEIPNNDFSKGKYFARIAFQGFIITGRGKIHDSDANRWLIYFTHPDEPYHADSGHPWELKNSLLE